MEHILNCHNEWFYFFGVIPFIPFMKIWFKTKYKKFTTRRKSLCPSQES